MRPQVKRPQVMRQRTQRHPDASGRWHVCPRWPPFWRPSSFRAPYPLHWRLPAIARAACSATMVARMRHAHDTGRSTMSHGRSHRDPDRGDLRMNKYRFAAVALSVVLLGACTDREAAEAERARAEAAAGEAAAKEAESAFDSAVAAENWALAKAQADLLFARHPTSDAADRVRGR